MHKSRLSPANIRRCTLQSLFAALFLLLAFWGIRLFHSTLWVASLGASAFIAFSFPTAQSAKPRVLIGGYLCASLWGCLGGLAYPALSPGGDNGLATVFCVTAAFFTMLCMNLLDMEHPPSAALAISIVLAPQPLPMAGAAIVAMLALCLVKKAALPLLAAPPGE